ncbi:MAG: FAD-binding protein [Chloroflexi bacterium]|nr:FAD-binding protein [Chloroflexota bacterium]
MKQLQCEVLVIGGGLGGCWAALRARELGSSVVLADISRVSRSGKSSFSGAGILFPEASDDLDNWHREIVEKGEYLNDQDWVRVMLEEQGKRMDDMARWGLTLERDGGGKVYRHVGLNHGITRIVTVSSLEMMEVLRRRLEAGGVTLHERVMITDLLTSDGNSPTSGTVVGALGFDVRTGESLVVNAGATVVASGTTGLFGTTGEGIVAACRAGAEVTGMEFSRCFDDMCFEDNYMGVGVHLNTFQRLGLKLVNADGERFMERYFANLKERGRREDLGLSIILEGLRGKAPTFIDLRHFDNEAMAKLHTLPTTAWIVRALEEEGIDFARQRVRYNVTSGNLSVTVGGIRNNIFGETSVPGLYVAGEAGGYPAHGTYSVGGVNLAMCCVGGYRAGENAARFSQEYGARVVVRDQARDIEWKVFRPLRARTGLAPQQLIDDLHGFLSPAEVGVFKNAASIKKVIRRLGDWTAMARQLKASDPHELVKAVRAARYVECTGLMFHACLIREETRANNIRIDFPYKDNVNWLQWVIHSVDSRGRQQFKTVPVPLYRYPVKPEAYARVPVGYPLPYGPTT